MKKIQAIEPDMLSKIHGASLKILEETGVLFHHYEVLEIFKNYGAKVQDKLVKLSPELVEKCLEKVPERFTWKARNDNYTRTMGDGYLLQPAA